MLQVECPAVTPEVVLRASGHVERFTDLMVTDVVTHDCHRADHLLEHVLEAMLEDTKKPVSSEQRAVRPSFFCHWQTLSRAEGALAKISLGKTLYIWGSHTMGLLLCVREILQCLALNG